MDHANPTTRRKLAPHNANRAARAIGRRFRTLCLTSRHVRVDDIARRFEDFRILRTRVRSENGGEYSAKRERPLWRAFLAGISGK